MLVSAVPGSLPGELHRVDENQSCGHVPVCLVERDWVGREAGHFGEQCAVERDGCRRIEFCRCGGDEREVNPRVVADRLRDVGCERPFKFTVYAVA